MAPSPMCSPARVSVMPFPTNPAGPSICATGIVLCALSAPVIVTSLEVFNLIALAASIIGFFAGFCLDLLGIALWREDLRKRTREKERAVSEAWHKAMSSACEAEVVVNPPPAANYIIKETLPMYIMDIREFTKEKDEINKTTV